MKKFSILCTLIFAFTWTSFGQDVPPFPSVDATYKKVLGFNAVYEALKKDYKIENPKACKFEKIMTIGGGDVIKSDFSSYQTDHGRSLNYRWPHDRCYTVFTVTTPPSSEGVTYKLPLVVEYTRIKHDVLTNNWEFYWWYFDTPYSTKGGKDDQLFFELTIEALKKIEGKIVPFKRGTSIPPALEDMTSISKIEKNPKEQDLREMRYSDKDYLTRHYICHGTATKFQDSDEAIVEQNFKGSKAYISVQFVRPKDESGKTGDWSVYKITGTNWQLDRGEPSEDKNLYQTLASIGFDKVYKKPPTPKTPTYFSRTYQDQFDVELEKALIDLYFQKEGAEDNLRKLLIPDGEAILKSFQDYFADMRAKFVDLKEEDGKITGITSSLAVYTDAEKCKLRLYINGKRKSYATDKSLKKKYKAAGMTKDVLNRYNGSHTDRESHDFKLELLNGQLKIAEPIKRKDPIPF